MSWTVSPVGGPAIPDASPGPPTYAPPVVDAASRYAVRVRAGGVRATMGVASTASSRMGGVFGEPQGRHYRAPARCRSRAVARDGFAAVGQAPGADPSGGLGRRLGVGPRNAVGII